MKQKYLQGLLIIQSGTSSSAIRKSKINVDYLIYKKDSLSTAEKLWRIAFKKRKNLTKSILKKLDSNRFKVQTLIQ